MKPLNAGILNLPHLALSFYTMVLVSEIFGRRIWNRLETSLQQWEPILSSRQNPESVYNFLLLSYWPIFSSSEPSLPFLYSWQGIWPIADNGRICFLLNKIRDQGDGLLSSLPPGILLVSCKWFCEGEFSVIPVGPQV